MSEDPLAINRVVERGMDKFPSFKDAFESGGWLPFLGFMDARDNEIRDALSVVATAIKSSPRASEEVLRLLEERNWRPNLIGAVAMLSGVVTPETIRALWGAIDRRSWVVPQLAVVAFKVDDEFLENAKLRILAIRDAKPLPNYFPNQHPGVGPSGTEMAKDLAALVFLYTRTLNPERDIIAMFEADPIKSILLTDEEFGCNGKYITGNWLLQTEKYFATPA